MKGQSTDRARAAYRGTKPYQTPNTSCVTSGVRRRVIKSYVERGTTQTSSQGPKVLSKWKRMWSCCDNQEVGLEAAILQSCLLYTSPSPRDRQKSRMPSSA
eukprot:TRINITY_DN1036_c0_g1_i1.p1 TRINITY_DN1036_c0_g1~~TRINITY_DN1036_c0_g1_i1.p1  ORF type:complete len:101 (+),score=1.53 TRINITY_DN1036_c0_g1_i1:181-483(+)